MSEDNKEVPKFERGSVTIDFATLNKLILRDLSKSKNYNKILKKYSRDDIGKFSENPANYEKQTRDLSTILYNKSPHYKRLITYFSTLLPLFYILEPCNIEFDKNNANKLKNSYKKVSQMVELMNIRHEFLKVLAVAYREDVYYGYEFSSDGTNYFFQKLDPDFCSLSSIEDGCYNIAFDYSYFQSNPELLEMFPPEFKKGYNRFVKDPTKMKVQELDSTKTICIKINEDLTYVMPPFFSTFEAIFDIEDYKALRKDKEEISNYKIIYQKIPMRTNSDANDDFLINLDTAMVFHNKAAQVVPNQVGIITAPFEAEGISFEKDQADFDNVAKAERDFWNTTGVSQLLFNADKTTSVGLSYSTKTDEAMAYRVLRQIERWINRKIKMAFGGNQNFRVRMLDTSIFNQEDQFKQLLEAGNAGMPVKTAIASILGMSPSSMMNMLLLENDILGINDKLIPLPSAHTLTGNGEAGAPSKADSKISDEGTKTRDANKGNNN